jgi:hypothetical protein
MTVSEFYNAVAKRADTEKTKISAADTSRVLSEAFQVLASLDTATLMDLLAKGLAGAKKKEK